MDADGFGGVLVIHRDRDRQRQGVKVVHKAYALRFASSKRCGTVSRLKPDYRNEKNFKDRAVFECLGGRLQKL